MAGPKVPARPFLVFSALYFCVQVARTWTELSSLTAILPQRDCCEAEKTTGRGAGDSQIGELQFKFCFGLCD